MSEELFWASLAGEAAVRKARPTSAGLTPRRRGRTSAPRSLRASGKPRQWRGRARAKPRPTAAYETTGIAEADPATAVTPTAPSRKLHEFSTPEPFPVWVGASAARPRPRGARCRRPQRRGRTSAPRSLRASGRPRQWRGRARARPRPTAAYETTGIDVKPSLRIATV